jgi:hypothetical protein
MDKGRYKYFPVVQNPEKATFRRQFVFVNKREFTGPDGTYHPAVCLSVGPSNNGIYVVDTEAEYAKEKLAVLERNIKEGIYPIIGPFDTIEEAIVAERKIRPLSDKEKLAQFNANANEIEILRRKNAELESKLGSRNSRQPA